MTAGVRNVILAEFTPYDPVAAAPVTVRVCSVDDARVTSLNGVAWWPAIATCPRRTIDLFDGEFGGRITPAIGDIEIITAAFPLAPRFSWGEQPVKLWRGVLGDAWGSYVQIFQGLTRPARGSNGRLRIGLRVDDRWLDRPLLSTYAGTGAAEGPADLKGVPKPLALGAPQFIEGVLINRTLNIYQLHGYGAMNGVPTALDRLNRFGAAAGNDANYATLAAATIAPGAWRTCLAEGLVRFGAPPAGVTSFLAQGDSGSALGWVRTPGQVIRRIALIAGATAAQIDTVSLAALDTAVPFNISLFLRDQTTAREVIQSIAASCNASSGISHLGKLFVARAGIGSPVQTLSANGSTLPPVASVELLESSAPFWRLGLEAERTERVHSAGEFGQIDFADVGGATKPDANATFGGERIANPGLTNDTSEWVLDPGITRVVGLATDPGSYLQFSTGAVRNVQTNSGARRPIGGGPLFWSAWVFRVAAATASMTAFFNWFRADGSAASTAFTSVGISPVAANVWVRQSGKVTPPADAVSFRLDFSVSTSGGVVNIAVPSVSTNEPGADQTALQPIVSRLSPATGQAASDFVLSTGLRPSQIVASGASRDGDAISFSPALAGVPEIIFLPGGNTGTAGQNLLIIAEGRSASGFTLRAKTQNVTPGSTITDTGATAGSGSDPDRVMNRSSGSNPFNSTWTFSVSVTVGDIAPGEPGTIDIGIYLRIGGSWIQVGAFSRGASQTVVIGVAASGVDFGAGNEFGVNVEYAEGAGTGISSFNSVAYTPGTVTEVSLTPAGASSIPWIALL